jgi:hypothetical protein
MPSPAPLLRWSVFLCLAVAIAAQLARAETVVSKDGHFAVAFPAQSRASSAPVQMGNVTIQLNVVAVEQENFNYYVSYSDYSPGSLAETAPDQAYANIVSSTVAGVHGKLRSSTPFQLGNVTGREVVIDVPSQGQVARERLFLAGSRLFQVVYGGPPGSENGKSALDFLNSFKLLP